MSAIQYTGGFTDDLLEWISGSGGYVFTRHPGGLEEFRVRTLLGNTLVGEGDWIVKELAGWFGVYSDKVFREMYEEDGGWE